MLFAWVVVLVFVVWVTYWRVLLFWCFIACLCVIVSFLIVFECFCFGFAYNCCLLLFLFIWFGLWCFICVFWIVYCGVVYCWSVLLCCFICSLRWVSFDCVLFCIVFVFLWLWFLFFCCLIVLCILYFTMYVCFLLYLLWCLGGLVCCCLLGLSWPLDWMMVVVFHWFTFVLLRLLFGLILVWLVVDFWVVWLLILVCLVFVCGWKFCVGLVWFGLCYVSLVCCLVEGLFEWVFKCLCFVFVVCFVLVVWCLFG